MVQKKVLSRRYSGCAESFVLKRKGGGDLAVLGGSKPRCTCNSTKSALNAFAEAA